MKLANAGGVLLAVAIAGVLTATYVPVVWYGTRYALRRSQGRRARRHLVQAAAETAAHLVAIALIAVVLIATGRYGHTLLADLGSAIAMGVREPALTVAGLAIGVAEAGLAALAASVLLASARPQMASATGAGRATATTATAWLSLPRSGWARRWPRPGDGPPVAAAGVVLLVGAAAEETVFRGLLITAMRPLGGPVAVATASLVYLGYGLTRPAARGSLAEAGACCLVLSIVNGTLFWLVPALLPLVAAQLAFVIFIG